MGLRLRRGLAGHARAARRQGRQRRRDDARARRRARPGRLHDHHRGLRRLHAAPARRSPTGWPSRSPRRSRASRSSAGKQLGDADDPLLVSVRSRRARVDAGMLDTVLNLGLNDESVEGLAEQTENERFAWDSYRRFVQMFGNVVRGIEGERFEDAIKRRQGRPRRQGRHRARRRRAAGAHRRSFKELYEFPQDPQEQLRAGDPRRVRLLDRRARGRPTGASTASPTTGAPRSTSSRWCSATRATQSGSGVAFSRDEVTGAPEPSGDFLVNAQGEDVVSGVRNTRDIAELSDVHARGARAADGDPAHARAPLQATCRTPSSRSRRGSCTCCRRATPSARRRRRCASPCDAVDEGLLDKERGAADDRRRARSTRCCTRPSTPRPSTRCSPRASPPRRARPRARSSSPPTRRSQAGRGRARRDPRAPVHRGRRRRRLPRGQGDPHHRGRQGLARRAGRARDGRARR